MKLPRKKREETSAATMQTLWLLLVCSMLFVLSAYATDPSSWNDPSWWSSSGTGSQAAVLAPQVTTNGGVVTTNYIANNNVVVTQGQLKQFTARAVDELNANLTGGAGTNLNTMVSNWAADYATNGYNATNIKPSDYAAMNVGQLKYVGNKVWAQLVAAGYTNAAPSWLAENTNTDYALADLGQLKEVFNFDLSAWRPPADSPPEITSAASVTTAVDVTFSYTITASNTPTSFSVSGLPAGLSVNTSTGVISGTPTVVGTSTVTLNATNASGTDTIWLTLTVTPALPAISSGTTASGDVGVVFSYAITASNAPTSFSASGLPAGLSLNTGTGVISGTPTGTGTSTVTLGATNGGGTGNATLTLIINSATAPVITSATTANLFEGTAFSYTITASNSPTSFSETGTLPAGLSLDGGTGIISGTPTGPGTSIIPVTIQAANSSGTGSASLILTLNPTFPVISSSTTASGNIGSAFSYTITGSNTPTSFSATGLPPGLSINTSTGVVSGTPAASGTFAVTLGAINSGGTGTATLTLTIGSPVPMINSSTAVTADVGVAFSYAITTSTVPAPTSYGESGTLPAGLSFDSSTGVISGTPTTAGASTITLSAANTAGTGTATLTLTVNSATAPIISSASTVSANVGSSFNYTVTASNSPTSFSETGTLPAGLSLNTSTGVISGTPTTIGSSTVTLDASNSAGTGTLSLALTVNPPVPVISSATTASGAFGVAITPYSITATNSPTTYAATGLPPGLSVDTFTGEISGVPTMAGTWTTVLSATNAGGSGTADLIFTIGAGNSPIVPTSIAAGDYHTLVLHSEGTVWAAGDDFNWQLGNVGDVTTVSYVKVLGLPSGIIAVAGEGISSLALASDGTVWAWGYNGDGELGNGDNTYTSSYTPVQVRTSSGLLTGIIAIAGGEEFGMALRKDGTIWTWGDNSQSELGNGDETDSDSPVAVQVSQSTGLTKAVAIGCGSFHGMAVKSDGTVWCWGGNDSGALGDGTTDDRNVPVQVPSLTGITAVSGGGGYYYTNDYSVALGNDGTVWTWGDNTYGELGNGNTTESDVPYHVSDLSGISSVIADKGDHTLALKGDGTVWTWGNNDYGQLGNGTTTESHVPGPISSLTGIVSLSSGLDEIVALKNDGTLYGWGYNGDDSELAAGGSAATQTATPATVSNLSGITAIAAAKSHYLALKSDGTVWTWDDTTPGEISNGTTITGSSSAIQVSGLSGITQVACGTYFNMVLKSDGTVWAWGQNANGELGDGSTTDSQTPEEVYTSSGPLSGITAITCTGSFGMALKSDGTVWTWGANGSGQLGNGNTTSTDTAAEILTGITAIGAGAIDAYAIKSDGTVLAWGDNTYGQLGNGSLTLPYSPTPASVSGLTGITAVVGGYYFELALKSDGTVWTWGENQVGQLGNGTITTANDVPAQISSLTGITAISAGEDSFHSIALKNDGTLWGWGSNSNGQLGTGTYGSIGGTSPTGSDVPVQVQGLSGVTVAGLACGKYSTVALESTGAVLEWGDSSYEPIGFSVPISVTDPQVTPAPVITPAAGSYSSSQTVAISTTLGSGTIHYTLDGTAPTASSPSYTGSFTLSQSALVSAVVIYNGAAVSPMASTQFYINDTDETGLPPTPTGLTASAASVSEIDLSWTVSGMQTYSQIYVYRSTNGGSYSLIAILGPTATTFADTSITAGNSYTYKVGTSNQAGISSTSASSSVDPSGPAALTIQITTPSGATSLP